jgi:hypothetical protein
LKHIFNNTASHVEVTKSRKQKNINSDKIKYTVMSQGQDAGRGHTIKNDNSSLERVEELKYLGTTLMNQNSIQEEIKSRLKSWKDCYHAVQNLLSSSLLSKNVKIKTYSTIIVPVVVKFGCSH